MARNRGISTLLVLLIVSAGLFLATGLYQKYQKPATPTTQATEVRGIVSSSVLSPTLTSPNGGEVWQRLHTYKITWTQTDSAASTSLHIYTRGSGSAGDTYIGTIAYNVSNLKGNNSYSWTIPPAGGVQSTPPDGNNIIVEVVLRGTSGIVISSDKSNSPFRIFTPKVKTLPYPL
jgi:hypothetical protein